MQISHVAYWSPAWKRGQSEFERQSWRHVPMCPLSFETVFGSVSFSLALSLISSRQAVWRGLKAFTEPSPGLINTHFLLEILAQTNHRLRVIRWWHPVQPWLKLVHCSIQCLRVQGMHIMEAACHQFILESKDYCDTLQPYTLSLFPFSLPLSLWLIFMLLHAFTDYTACMYLPHRGSEAELVQKPWRQSGSALQDETDVIGCQKAALVSLSLPSQFSRDSLSLSFAFCMLMISCV